MTAIDQRVAAGATGSPAPSRSRRVVGGAGVVAAAIGLFFSYLTMSKTQPMNADGASQALQAWDLLHGNLLLSGWTVSDVSFFTNELPILALAEAVNGLNGDAVHICAAILYTLLVLLVAALARGRSTGREAVARITIAVVVMAVPMAGMGTSVLLLSPDHTGTAVPLLLAWLIIDRWGAAAPRWLPYAVGVVLMAAQVSDPLALYVGAVPLSAVCGLRMWRAAREAGQRWPRWRGPEAALVGAAIASALGSRLILVAIHTAGGFHVHGVPAGIANPARMLENVQIMAVALSVNFGAYFHDRNPGLDTGMGAARLVLLLVTLAVVVAVLTRFVRRRPDQPGRLVDELLLAGVGVNLGAFVVSTIPFDATSARQIAAVLFLGAALVGRTVGPWLAARRWLPVAVAALVVVFGAEFATRLTEPAVRHEHYDAAEFLESRGLTYGLGGFWTANNLTLQTGGVVHVAPIIGETEVFGYRWLSKADWYDPTKHDARFVVIHANSPAYGTVDGVVKQFGEPVERKQLGLITILLYDKNLLVGLPAWCMPDTAPSMAQCP